MDIACRLKKRDMYVQNLLTNSKNDFKDILKINGWG